MRVILSFLIIFVFFLVTIVVMYGVCTKGNSEQFYPTPTFRGYSPSKFFTYPLSNKEKINSLYSPIICRPPEHSALTYNGNCTSLLYPKSTSPWGKGEMAAPCDPAIEAKYYAMRPLLQSHGYEAMLQILFEHITEKVPSSVNQESLVNQNELCDKNCYSTVMKFILGRINEAKNKLKVFKDYAKNDTWGGEQFAFLNEKVFSYTDKDYSILTQQEQARIARNGDVEGPMKLVITFTLHNTLRSASTDLVAIVIRTQGKYFLKFIDFATKQPTNKLSGVSISTKAGSAPGINLNNASLPPGPNKPEWIYGNTMENQTFNLKGFHDPDEKQNILIPGGVPSEFEGVLQKCDQAYLLKPDSGQGPRFKGGKGNNDATKTAPIYPMMPNKNTMKWEVNV